MKDKAPILSTAFNVAVALALLIIFFFVYVSRYTLGELVFEFVIFGFLIAGGVFFWKNILNKDAIKHDERTEAMAGKAARITLALAFAAMVILLAYLEFSDRPTSANGVLAVLAGFLISAYAATYMVLENR